MPQEATTFVAGRLAAYVGRNGTTVTVSLRRPPPLERELQVTVE